MQNAVQVFESQEFGEVRVMHIDGHPWWVLKDVCAVLALSDTNRVAERLDADELTRIKLVSGGQTRSMYAVSESGLYAVIVRSDKPNARAFRKWITSEVLPSIRKHGAYINDDVLHNMQEDSDYSAELLRNLTAERNRSNALINKMAQLAPKAHYHDIILQCPDAIPVTFIAKDYGVSSQI